MAGPETFCAVDGVDVGCVGDNGELFMLMWTLSVVNTGGNLSDAAAFVVCLNLLEGSCKWKQQQRKNMVNIVVTHLPMALTNRKRHHNSTLLISENTFGCALRMKCGAHSA